MPQAHDLNFVLSILSRLEQVGIRAWLFGGWAEELRGLRSGGNHGDIDLLYPANDFDRVDGFMAKEAGVEEIWPKHFSHKRAFEIEKIMVEITLVQAENGQFYTHYFSGLNTLQWPGDTFQWMMVGDNLRLPVTSETALRFYRQNHPAVEQAYRAFRT